MQDKIKVLVHGCFDILHAGHLAHFKAAKKYGNYLIVSVTADKYVNKGPGRPVFPQDTRMSMLKELSIIDEVVLSDSPTAIQVIENCKPSFYVKGHDYADRSKDITGEIYNEEAAVKKHGGELVFTDEETFSSSTLANRWFLSWSDAQQIVIEKIKELGGMDTIEKLFEDISKLKVTVIGEPILDIYRFVEPQNISSKSPSVSAKFLYQEEYRGGAWAIEEHLKGFCTLKLFPLYGAKVPKKIRYIAIDKSQRIFEVTEIDEASWVVGTSRIGPYTDQCDAVLIADFGHGLIEGELLAQCNEIKSFVALNSQTNSSNLPFNPFTKHKNYSYLCIDTREARIAFHDKNASPEELVEMIAEKSAGYCHSMTLGSNGAYFVSDKPHHSPAFADQVIDATGAGDAYFAITSLLCKVGAPPEMIPFLGNVFAGLKTKIIGNKASVTKAQFQKALTGILK